MGILFLWNNLKLRVAVRLNTTYASHVTVISTLNLCLSTVTISKQSIELVLIVTMSNFKNTTSIPLRYPQHSSLSFKLGAFTVNITEQSVWPFSMTATPSPLSFTPLHKPYF